MRFTRHEVLKAGKAKKIRSARLSIDNETIHSWQSGATTALIRSMRESIGDGERTHFADLPSGQNSLSVTRLSPEQACHTASLSWNRRVRTVQDYIDEVPAWPDGTPSRDTPLTRMQSRIFWLACAGKFFEGLVVFMTGVALPLIAQEFGLAATDKGLVTAASLAGILVGASVLGGLADRLGRRPLFIAEMGIFTLFLVTLTLAPNFLVLFVSLFGAGVALGCDYPTAHIVISESIPTRARGRLVLTAFAFQAVGAFAGTAVGFVILLENPQVEAWRWMYATAIVPAVLVTCGRFFVTESPHWLISRHRVPEAEAATLQLLKRRPEYPSSVELIKSHPESRRAHHYGTLFQKRNLRATILASVPWFLQDLGTYGIGIFTPTVLAAVVGSKTPGNDLSAAIHNDILGARGSAIMDVFFFVGIITAILLVEKVGRIKLQLFGFIGCAVGLLMAGLSIRGDGSNNMILLLVGFVVFYFMTNLGPNAMTYLLAGEVFPTPIRGRGAGFAASFAKLGAVLTAFFFPILLHTIGTVTLLYTLAGTSILGAAVSWFFAIETRGMNLESLHLRAGAEVPAKENGADLSSPQLETLSQARRMPLPTGPSEDDRTTQVTERKLFARGAQADGK